MTNSVIYWEQQPYFIESKEQVGEGCFHVSATLMTTEENRNHWHRIHCTVRDGEVLPLSVMVEGGTKFPEKFPPHWQSSE